MWNAKLDEAQPRIKIAGRSVNNLRNADNTTLIGESKEKLNILLMKVKEESEKAGLKLNIQKMKIMASSPIASWQVSGETTETVTDFIFWGSKITADGDSSHEFKRRVLFRSSLWMVTAAMKWKDSWLLLGRKAMTNLDSVLKSRDITLLTNVHIVKAMVFPVVM